jgi:hypothetical protein
MDRVMMFNTTFNNMSCISWRLVFLVEETGLLGKQHRPVASHWQTLSHNVVSSSSRHEPGFEFTTLVVTGTDCTGSCKSNYHMITTTTAPKLHHRRCSHLFVFCHQHVSLGKKPIMKLSASTYCLSFIFICDLNFWIITKLCTQFFLNFICINKR